MKLAVNSVIVLSYSVSVLLSNTRQTEIDSRFLQNVILKMTVEFTESDSIFLKVTGFLLDTTEEVTVSFFEILQWKWILLSDKNIFKILPCIKVIVHFQKYYSESDSGFFQTVTQCITESDSACLWNRTPKVSGFLLNIALKVTVDFNEKSTDYDT